MLSFHLSPIIRSFLGIRTFRLILLIFLLIVLLQNISLAQLNEEPDIPEKVVKFGFRLEPQNPRPGEHARVILDLKIHAGWHIFSTIPIEGDFVPIPTSLILEGDDLLLLGPVYESNPITDYNNVLGLVLSYHDRLVR